MKRGNAMDQLMMKKPTREQGFSLIEVLIGVLLVAVAVLGLVQLFLMGVMNNTRSSEIANSVFLAQQEIDYLRSLTLNEITAFPDTTRGESDDELIDVNADGTPDYRRLTVITNRDPAFDIRILVFPPAQISTGRDELVADPEGHRVRARMETVISR
jgi:prepilin-type N-terminal cleavage/methylation domain-containing protein